MRLYDAHRYNAYLLANDLLACALAKELGFLAKRKRE